MRLTIATALCSILVLLTPAVMAQDRAPYRVPQTAREALVAMKATVEHGSAGGDFTAHLTPGQVESLRRRGFQIRPLAPEPPVDPAADGAPDGLGGWTSYAVMRADFQAYAAAHPSIAQYHVIGTSVLGRELFGLRISDNVQLEENEPELLFCANIHGNEFVSGEIAYRYALALLDGYGVDAQTTGYVDDNEIWVFPLLNPDGHEIGVRENANGIDLNRDFGWQWDNWGGSPKPNSQVETRALNDFLLENNITLSVTMHSSGNVFLYPWCASPANVPELALVQWAGKLYSNPAGYQLLNSWVDYETHGELLDLIYGGHGALCYTAEISNNLNLFANSYARNAAGMNAYCAAAGLGLAGLVTDAVSGQPLRAAVTVSGSPYPAYTDPVLGDVHRMVVPGSYDVTVWASGYEPQTLYGLQVQEGGTTQFQVALVPGGNEHAFIVQSVNQRDPSNQYNNLTSPADALGAPDGRAVSLGREGDIILDLGAGHGITDGPGVDFTVTEALVPGDLLPEAYAVYARAAYGAEVLVGSGLGTQSFDLAAAGVSFTRFLRIVDASGAAADAPLAGVELDAISVLNGVGPPSLDVDTTQISLSAGGTQNYSLAAPSPGALYLILGTTAGASPGQGLPQSFLTLPLNPSAYFSFTLLQPNLALQDSLGLLDGSGQKTASMTLPAGLDAGLAGVSFQHAFVLLDGLTLAPTFISNPVSLQLVP